LLPASQRFYVTSPQTSQNQELQAFSLSLGTTPR
jgi:hypothetical protein